MMRWRICRRGFWRLNNAMRIERELLEKFRLLSFDNTVLPEVDKNLERTRVYVDDVSPRIILASGSQNRRQFMEALKVPFAIMPSNFDEKSMIAIVDPHARVKEIARMKAYSIAANHTGLIIAGDTFNMFDGHQYEKPVNLEEAKRMLRELSGKIGESITGICILNTIQETETTVLKTIPIKCKELDKDEIETYVRGKPVTQWAATYNPLDDTSKSIFQALAPYTNGLEYGLSADVIMNALLEAGIQIDTSNPFKTR